MHSARRIVARRILRSHDSHARITGETKRLVPRRLRRLLDYAPLDMTDLLDLDLHNVADLEISRRFHRYRDAARRAGRNDRAGQQREHRRQRLDAGEAIENEMLRVRVLSLLAVDPRMQFERMRVRNLVCRYDPRP